MTARMSFMSHAPERQKCWVLRYAGESARASAHLPAGPMFRRSGKPRARPGPLASFLLSLSAKSGRLPRRPVETTDLAEIMDEIAEREISVSRRNRNCRASDSGAGAGGRTQGGALGVPRRAQIGRSLSDQRELQPQRERGRL